MAKSSLAGVPLLGDRPVVWRLTTGVRPYVGTFAVRIADVDTLLRETLRPVSLVHNRKDREETYSGLFILHARPSENPHVGLITVADRRWLWSRGHILRRFNIRRRTGVKRLEDPQQVRETMRLTPEVQYAPYSLLDGKTVWTPLLALNEMERAILAHEKDSGFTMPGFEIDGSVGSRLGTFPIENLELDDPLDVAFEKVLATIPEAQVTVGADGKVYVYSRADNAEKAVIESSGDEVVGGGHVEFVEHRRTRPREIRVLFSRNIETRFDAVELELGATTDRNPESLFMDNVLPVPDFTLALTSGQTVTQGNWITFPEALAAWNAQNVPGLSNLTIGTLRKAAIPFVDLWAAMNLSGTHDPDNAWAARVAAMQTHFRRTYRINRRVMDRLLQIHDYRVAVQDPTGTARGTAQAFSDYAVIPGQRWINATNTDASFAINVLGYPLQQAQGEPDRNDIDANTKPAPAVVRIIDADQGIIHVDWAMDPARTYEMVLPSMVEMEGSGTGQNGKPTIPGPSGDLSDRRRSIAFNSALESLSVPQLTAAHKLAVILTATPGSPNTEAQLEVVTVTPTDVRDLVPEAMVESLLASDGPPMEVRIGAGMEEARVAWIDKERDKIEKALGIRATKEGEKLDLKPLIVNYSEAGFSNQFASLQSIAKAEAARIWASMLDRHYGSKTVDMDATIRPVGRIDAVSHVKGTDGSMLTSMELSQTQPEESVFSFLSGSVVRVIRRLANMGRTRT